jgi:hypothetical protein
LACVPRKARGSVPLKAARPSLPRASPLSSASPAALHCFTPPHGAASSRAPPPAPHRRFAAWGRYRSKPTPPRASTCRAKAPPMVRVTGSSLEHRRTRAGRPSSAHRWLSAAAVVFRRGWATTQVLLHLLFPIPRHPPEPLGHPIASAAKGQWPPCLPVWGRRRSCLFASRPLENHVI